MQIACSVRPGVESSKATSATRGFRTLASSSRKTARKRAGFAGRTGDAFACPGRFCGPFSGRQTARFRAAGRQKTGQVPTTHTCKEHLGAALTTLIWECLFLVNIGSDVTYGGNAQASSVFLLEEWLSLILFICVKLSLANSLYGMYE